MTSMLSIALSNFVFASVLAVIALAVTRIWRSPHLAHALWALVLVKLLTPPLTEIPVTQSWFITGSADVTSAEMPAVIDAPEVIMGTPTITSAEVEAGREARSVPTMQAPVTVVADLTDSQLEPRASNAMTAASPAVDTVQIPWPMLIAGIWCIGSAGLAATMLRRIARFRRLLSASETPPENVRAATRRLAAAVGLRRCPDLRVVHAAVPPLVWSLGLRPRIVVPVQLLEELNERQRDSVIAHELAHIRRRDDLVRWLEFVVLVAWWWNPVAWLARRRLHEAEEACCDAWVVSVLPGQRRSYGEALLKTIEFLSESAPTPVPIGSAFGVSFYQRRVEMIMNRQVSRQMSVGALCMVVLLAAGILPVGAQTNTDDAPPVSGESALSQSSTVSSSSDDAPRVAVCTVRGIFTNRGQPVADRTVHIVGAQGERDVLMWAGSTGDDGVFEFTEMPENTSWRIRLPMSDPNAEPPMSRTLSGAAEVLIADDGEGQVLWSIAQSPLAESPAASADATSDASEVDEPGGETTPKRSWPKPVDPEPPFCTVRGVILNREQMPVSRHPVWIIGKRDNVTLLYSDGPTGADGSYEFEEIPADVSWQVFVPFGNGPDGIATRGYKLQPAAAADVRIVLTGDYSFEYTVNTNEHGIAAQGEPEANLAAAAPMVAGLPNLPLSQHADERELQQRLLTLDVESAEATYTQAVADLERLQQLGDAVSGSEVSKQRTKVRESQVQLERATTILELFRLQSQRLGQSMAIPTLSLQIATGSRETTVQLAKVEYEILSFRQDVDAGVQVSQWAGKNGNQERFEEWLEENVHSSPAQIGAWLNNRGASVATVTMTGPVNLEAVRAKTAAGAEKIEVGPWAVVFQGPEMILVRHVQQTVADPVY